MAKSHVYRLAYQPRLFDVSKIKAMKICTETFVKPKASNMWETLITLVTVMSAIGVTPNCENPHRFSFAAADSDMSFSCDFERDTCGFTNQEGLLALWERKEMELDGKTGYMMVVESNDTSAQLSKMITPYFELDESIPGCLSFDLYTTGIQIFGVQQERNFGIISVWTKSQDEKAGWQKPRFNIDIDESTRFFFEAVLGSRETDSLAAVDNVRLELKKC